VSDAASEVIGIGSDLFESVQQGEHEIVAISGAAVGQALFGQFPDSLVGVVLRRVGGETLQVQPAGAAAEVADEPAAMGVAAVPQDDDMAGQVAQQLTQEVARLELPDVLQVELEVKVQALTLGTDRDARDGRDPVAPIEVVNCRRLAHGGPGPGNGGSQLKARFVDKDEVGAQPRGVFFTLGHSCRTKRRISAPLRSSAFFCGFWWLQPRECRTLPT